MLFTLDLTKEAEERIAELTRKLIESTLLEADTLYLPYRNYASPDRLHRSFPGLASFLETKKSLDPQTIFASGFYDYLLKSRKEWNREP